MQQLVMTHGATFFSAWLSPATGPYQMTVLQAYKAQSTVSHKLRSVSHRPAGEYAAIRQVVSSVTADARRVVSTCQQSSSLRRCPPFKYMRDGIDAVQGDLNLSPKPLAERG